jgi:dipeptidyl aminopeptidase/acylaminoacyl peptidase
MKHALALLLFAATVAAAHAQPNLPKAAGPAPLAIEDVWRPPAIAEPRLSPNGRYFAVLAPVNDRLNLAVIDLETRKGAALTNYRDFDVQQVRWVGNDYLVFTLGESNAPSGAGMQRGGGLFSVSREGKDFRQISPTIRDQERQGQYVYRAYQYLTAIPGSEDEFIAVGNLRTIDSADIYRINVRTGRATLASTDRPEGVPLGGQAVEGQPGGAWLLDSKQVPRVVGAAVKDTTTAVIHYRASASAPWKEIARFDVVKGPAFVPLGFAGDDKTLLVATNAGRPTMAVFKYDPEAGKLGELLAEHPKFDLGADALGGHAPGPVFDPQTDKVIGFRVMAEKPEVVWTDPAYQRIQRLLDGALPNAVNTFSRAGSGDRMLVTSYSDRQPPRWFFFDEKKLALEELFSSRPWIKPEQLVEMRPFTLKTRDGLEISSYYFLPANHKPGDRHPTVVHIHGGPHVRADTWGQWTSFGMREAQLLASRGYAVVLPNFRITPGMGSKIFYGGFGAYGRQMVQDHVDAARWAIEQGFADPARICVSGASYGGSAVLFSMGQAPEIFKCGIAGLLVADKKMQLTSSVGDVPRSKAGVQLWLSILGAESTSTIPDVVSPIHLANRIKGPIMIYAGADDVRTPREQTEAMIAALERAGNPPKKVIIKPEEGHGFGRLQNRIELYNAIFEFLDTTIGPKSGAKAQ